MRVFPVFFISNSNVILRDGTARSHEMNANNMDRMGLGIP